MAAMPNASITDEVCELIYADDLCRTCPFTDEQVAAAAADAARRWKLALVLLSVGFLAVEAALVVAAVVLRRRRQMQLAGPSFLVLILAGCAAGTAATGLDAFAVSPALCRLRLALLYLFVTLLLAARLGRLISHVKRARMYHAVGAGGGRALGWDLRAQKAAAGLIIAQLLALGAYLGVAADEPATPSCLYSVCSLAPGELAFNGLQVGVRRAAGLPGDRAVWFGFCPIALLLSCCFVAWLGW